MAPSDPPDTRRGWNGCQATAKGRSRVRYKARNGSINIQQTSFLCPFNTRNSFIALMSNTRTVWSLDALATIFPFGDQDKACIVFLCWCLRYRSIGAKLSEGRTYRVDRHVPVRGSQNFIMLSLLPETKRPFVGCHSTHFTSHPWPEEEGSGEIAAVIGITHLSAFSQLGFHGMTICAHSSHHWQLQTGRRLG